MMQQIVPAYDRRAEAREQGKQTRSNFMDKIIGQQQQKKSDAQLSKLLGMDVSGLSPEMKQEAFKQAMQSQHLVKEYDLKKELEIEKQKAKYEQKGKALQGLFTRDGEEEPTDFSSELMKEPTPITQETKRPTKIQEEKSSFATKQPYSQKQIDAALMAGEPAIAQRMQADNKTTLEQQQRKEDIAREKAEFQTKQISESYKENTDFINKVHDSYESASEKEGKLERMDELNESDKLSDSGTINALESMGLNPEWLKNPSNEEYTKLALDLLGGGTLQADYGSRVFASEFKVSQQRIPGLSQTKEGRRQISENLKVALLPAKLKKERMQYYLDRQERTNEPLPHDLRGKILRDIKPELEKAYDAFKERNGRYKVKKGTSPDENSIEKYYYLSEGDYEKGLQMMREDGYDVNE